MQALKALPAQDGPRKHATPDEDAVFAIIDTHQHLWDLNKFRLPWLKNAKDLKRDYLMRDYFAATANLGKFADGAGKIVKTVYMEVDLDPEQQVAEAEFVIDTCQHADNPMAAGVISGRPASDGFKKYITRFKDSAYIKGVRQVLHGESTPKGYCLDNHFIKGLRLLGDLNMSYDLCLRPGELLDGVKLIDACPDTRFILDHCGNANVQQKDRSQWQRDIAEVAKRKRVVCKVSGIVASANKGKWTADDLAPIVNHVLDIFGPDRVMFGGDWPVCTLAATYAQWVYALRTIVKDRSPEQQHKLFHDNAAAFYNLDS
jgi:predicted TIM-barrel fold metal-dependent hydrolase